MLVRRARGALLALAVLTTTVVTAAPASAAQTFKCGGDDDLKVCIDYDYFDGGSAGVGWSFYGYAYSANNKTIGPDTFRIIWKDNTVKSKPATVKNGNIVQLFWKHNGNGPACASWTFSYGYSVHACINKTS